jgi:enoyl-CoA hydratase/carnithine racemase
MTDKIIAKVEGGIGWLTLNNPERRNAISHEMWQGIIDAVDSFSADSQCRVVVMQGAGGKAFASGADISEFAEKRNSADTGAAYKELPDTGRARLSGLEKPLIAMIRGYALGGGLALAMKADIRIASEDSQLGIPAARLGLAYSAGALRQLVTLVGPSSAKMMLFTARRLTAAEALSIGLVDRVVPPDQLEAAVREWADLIAENAPLTIKAAKLTVDELTRHSEHPDTAMIDRLSRMCLDSEDYKEGRTAFMEKRKPVFTGR